MDFLSRLCIYIFGRYLAPETPVEIYFLGISHFATRIDRELTFMRHGTWNEFNFHNRKLPIGDFGIGNPVVILETYELPSEIRRTQLFTKTAFDLSREKLLS